MSILLQLPDLEKSALAGKDSGLLGCECMDTSTWPFIPEEAVSFALKSIDLSHLKGKLISRLSTLYLYSPSPRMFLIKVFFACSELKMVLMCLGKICGTRLFLTING